MSILSVLARLTRRPTLVAAASRGTSCGSHCPCGASEPDEPWLGSLVHTEAEHVAWTPRLRAAGRVAARDVRPPAGR